MHVLIAGVGWLGRAVAGACLERGWRVTGAKRTRAGVDALERSGIEVVVADLADPAAIERLPQDIDIIVACQAASGEGIDAYRAAYVDATRTLLEFALRRPVTGFVYTSSTGVFGQSDGGDVDETTPIAPTAPSSRILAEAESLVLSAARDRGLRSMVVRLSGLYGPERYGTIDRVRRGVLALGPGDETWMNFCHRDDAVAAILAALERGRPGAVYHASDGGPARRREVVTWISERLRIAPPVSPLDGSEAPAGRRGANRRILSERTRQELGLSLRYPTFREGFEPCFR